MTIVGRTYYERGDQPVVILARWRGNLPLDFTVMGVRDERAVRRFAPRNVLIRRADGELVVRPFRGLRREPRVPYNVAVEG